MFNERFMAARHEKGCYEKHVPMYFLVGGGLLNDDVGVSRGTAFQKIRPAS